jgi:hypothetical protein
MFARMNGIMSERHNAIWNPGNLKESILESGYHKVAQESILESGSDSRIDSSLW